MRSLLAALVLVVAGCGGSAVLRAADAGDINAFRSSLDERLKGDEVDLDEARDIAIRLMNRQIEGAQGPSGEQTLDEVAACALPFEQALAQRASGEDKLAAHAARIRVEVGMVPTMVYAHHVDHQDAAWRALAARSLGKPSPARGEASGDDEIELERSAVWRRKLMADPARDVRMSATRAAVDADDAGDVDALLQAARLDPYQEVRRAAIQALGAVGSREAVVGLKDVWTGADEEARVAIVEAWAAAWRKPRRNGDEVSCAGSASTPAQHPSCEAQHQLQRVMEMGEGMPTLMAALELVHWATPKTATPAGANAAAVLERLIDDSPTRIRVEAIASAPLSWAHLLEATVDAAEDKDDAVAIAALSRMTELTAKERAKALKKLRELAKVKTPAGDAAKAALVKAADVSVVKLIDADAKAKSWRQRATAAARFAELGQVRRVVALLGDKDARVRAQTVCAILKMED